MTTSLTACGGNGGGAPATSDTGPVKTGPVKIAVAINGTSITTAQTRVEVKRGQGIEFDLTASGSGELHVHSTPAQSFEYQPGKSSFTLKPLTIPGIVEVEEENMSKLIVQLVVR